MCGGERRRHGSMWGEAWRRHGQRPVREPVDCNDSDRWMKAEVTAIIESAPEGGFWAVCPEFPGANGQGETLVEARESLRQAIQLLSRIAWKTIAGVCPAKRSKNG